MMDTTRDRWRTISGTGTFNQLRDIPRWLMEDLRGSGRTNYRGEVGQTGKCS